VKAALVISSRDNVATALERLEPGRVIQLEGLTLTVAEPVASGHKLSLRAIAAGEPIVKYGSPIGTATADIPAGAHVHTHNVASNRGRGDLAGSPAAPQGRLAEPADDTLGSTGGLAPKAFGT
jgi:altronate dehydratase